MYSRSAINVMSRIPSIERLKVVNNHIRNMSVSSLLAEPKEMRIPLPCGGHIAGKIWNEGGRIPVLGLHGWLDNAGTFDTMAPLFPSQYCLVCIDFPGHGLSSRRSPGSSGSTEHLLIIIHRVINHFKWEKINIMGHSMGGGAAFLYACTLPDKVEKLILLDSVKPMQVDPSKQPSRTATYLESIFDFEKKLQTDPPSYDYEELVERMIKSYGRSISEESAKILVKRGSTKRENGTYAFNYDPQLKMNNISSMCHEQQKEFASRLKCEVLVLKASLGPLFEDKFYYEEILRILEKKSSKFIFEVIEGTHHVHLNNANAVMPFVEKFLAGELESSTSLSEVTL